MSDRAASTNPFILHIEGLSPQPGRIAEELDSLSVTVETCPDVYRGLARLGQAQKAPLAVLVCVDDLDPRELLFFQVGARFYPRVPLYAYGSGRAEALITQALECGASGRATVELLHSLVPTTEKLVIEPGVESPRTELLEDSEPVTVEAHRGNDLANEPPQEPKPATVEGMQDGQQEDGPEAPVGTARFPWKDYRDRPVRKPPPRSEPPAVETPSAPAANHAPEAHHEPLLTNAEMEALIGDDIPTMAPSERERNEQHDESSP